MRRAWVTVAALAGALCVPGTAFAVDHVSLFVSPVRCRRASGVAALGERP
jgi:hypothetical protein